MSSSSPASVLTYNLHFYFSLILAQICLSSLVFLFASLPISNDVIFLVGGIFYKPPHIF